MRCVKCGEPVDARTCIDCIEMDLPASCDECYDAVSEESFNGHSLWPFDWYGHWAWSLSNDFFMEHPMQGVKQWL